MAKIDLTSITPPRVPMTDLRTGLISREWYRFFLNLFVLTGEGQNTASLTDLQVGPEGVTQDQLMQLEQQIQSLAVQPVVDVADIYAQLDTIEAEIASLYVAPVTKTADFTIAASDKWLINNKSGSTCTVTLPSASTSTGRELTFQNYQPQLLVSASSNVVSLAGGSAGTAILAAVAGNWATLVSDGTNWIIMQAAVNNCLLIE